MSSELRRTIPIIITFILGVLFVTDFYVVFPPLRDAAGILSNMANVIIGFSFVVGGFTLTVRHGTNLLKRGDNWVFSILLLFMLWAAVIVGVYFGDASPEYVWLWETIYTPARQMFYGMWVFFYVSAIYRSFRFRSVETAILLIAGTLMLLGNAAIGAAIWSGFPEISTWIMSVITGGAFRGIVISAAVGYITTAIRVMLGYERGYMVEE